MSHFVAIPFRMRDHYPNKACMKTQSHRYLPITTINTLCLVQSTELSKFGQSNQQLPVHQLFIRVQKA